MNSTKTLLTLLVCLLPLSGIAGSVDGKSLVCKHNKNDRVVGFMFIDGTVTANDISEINLEYRITRFGESLEDKTYRETGPEFRWFLGYWVLNRKTLKLSYGKPVESSPKEYYVCEVFESFDDYHDKLVKMQSDKQRLLDDELMQNKI